MKLGISCRGIIKHLGHERAFSLIRESGFDAVDLWMGGVYGNRENPSDIYNASADEFEAHFTQIRKLAQNAGIEIASTHGRAATYTNDEAQCEYIRWVSERDLAATRILGAPTCVIHPVVMNYWSDRFWDKDFLLEINTGMYRDLLPFAEKHGVKIGLESMGKIMLNGEKHLSFFGCSGDIQRQLELLNSPCATVCVDTGHTNEAHFLGAPSPADMIRALGKNVTVLHLHDNNGTADLHLPPICDRRGCVNWPDVFDALDEVGYSGVYNMELTLDRYGKELAVDHGAFAVKVMRELISSVYGE